MVTRRPKLPDSNLGDFGDSGASPAPQQQPQTPTSNSSEGVSSLEQGFNDRVGPMPAPVQGKEETAPAFKTLFEYPEGLLDQLYRWTKDSDGNVQMERSQNKYDEDDAFWLMAQLTPSQLDQLLGDLWWAGFGADVPDGEDISRASLQGLAEAMDQANINGGHDVEEWLQSRAQRGKERGAPLGKEVDHEDLPAYQLQKLAAANDVTLSSEFVARAHTLIMNGDSTVEAEMQRVRDQVIAPQFPTYSEQIKAGQNVKDLAEPFITSMESLLELVPGTIGTDDTTIRRAMQGEGVKPMWAFEADLKADERWQYTNNAHEEMGSMVYGALSEMGLSA